MMKTVFILLTLGTVTLASAQQLPGPGPAGRGEMPFPGGRGRIAAPPRDNAPQPTGTGKIIGRVVAADTGSPIRRAMVSINSREGRFSRAVSTNSEGRYELTGLPDGRYRLTVNKAGFVSLEYGQARPFETGKPIDLAPAQVLERIDFSLPRGSVITGRITDEFGDPMTDVQVEAMRYQFVNGERQLVNAGRQATTDDIGAYRIFGLMPGDYIIRASARPVGPGRGSNDADDRTGYPGTYYPGVTTITEAQVVTVALSQELSSIAFAMVPARLSRISGTVMSSEGRPLTGAIVVVRPRGAGARAAIFNAMASGGGNQVRGDGTFQLVNVPPGDYTLDVQQRPQNLRNLQDGLAQLEFASIPVSVAGDIDNLVIVTTPGITVSGRVSYEGQNPPRSTMQVMATPPAGAPPIMAMAGRALGSGQVNQDGTFELRGIAGPQFIRVNGIPAGWALKTIEMNGADITDTAFDFPGGNNVAGLVVTLTNRISELTGSVRDARGMPAGDYVLVVFPENAKLWTGQSRYIATTRPNQNGTFSIKGLPPGRYLAAAVASLENGSQYDAAVLEQMRPRAQTFSLAEGQTLNLNLPMARE
jgi:hypothetical protein